MNKSLATVALFARVACPLRASSAADSTQVVTLPNAHIISADRSEQFPSGITAYHGHVRVQIRGFSISGGNASLRMHGSTILIKFGEGGEGHGSLGDSSSIETSNVVVP
jgi:hypothetical protein